MARDLLDKVSRIALAIERGGGDHLGPVETLHQDFMDVIGLIPQHIRDVADDVTFTTAPREGAAEGGLDEEAEEDDVRLSPPQAR